MPCLVELQVGRLELLLPPDSLGPFADRVVAERLNRRLAEREPDAIAKVWLEDAVELLADRDAARKWVRRLYAGR